MYKKRTDFDELVGIKKLPQNISKVEFNNSDEIKSNIKIYPSVIKLSSDMFTRMLIDDFKKNNKNT